jgi:predicted NACHT family NTPase
MTGFEPLIGAATAGLTGLIANLIQEKGGDLLKGADIDLGRGRAFNQAIQKYVRRYADRHGILKVACVRMDNPIKLEDIYTAVQLLPRSALRYYESTESLQELFRESGKRGFNFEDSGKKQGIEVANERQYLMVLGGPGVGKSTFLRKMGLEALRRHAIMTNAQGNLAALKPQEQYYAHDCIPVMLELRQCKADVNIKDVIAAEFETCGFPQAQEFTELCLQSGKLLVLLDGLDEVPGAALNQVITEIENLVDRYDNNRFIASCRVAAYTFGGFKRFNDVAMAAFEDDQIQRFIQNWFQKPRDIETETAKRCWALLSSPEYTAAKELAQTPLLLTLLCVIYDEFQDFPKHRHKVYGEALDVLLRKWAAEKRIQQEPIYQKFGSELELDLLAELAYNSFVDDQLFFSKQAILDHIQDVQAENANVPELDAAQILTEIEVQQGILVKRSRNAYSFSYLTFQEYLTAKCIVDNQKVDQLVRDHVTDSDWREVFLLTAGLMPGKRGADSLLLAMENKAHSLLNSTSLRILIRWAESEADNTTVKTLPTTKRVLALLIAMELFNAHSIAINLPFARTPEKTDGREFELYK